MLLAVFSDIHANLEAFRTALDSARRRGAESFVNLGDIVGYGPHPAACVELAREVFDVHVLGNHDHAVATGAVEELPPDGQVAARRHRDALSEDQLAWLSGLPLRASYAGACLAHAAPLDPARWPRLEGHRAVRLQFDAFDEDVCFVGHSHVPAVVSETLGVFRVRRGHRYLVNVGSVGQPRDRDPRLAYGLFDTEAFEFEIVREHYDHEKTYADILEASLPKRLGARLRAGQ